MENGTAAAVVQEDAKLMTKDYLTLIEYANRLSHVMNSMRNVEKVSYTRQRETAMELMKVIEENYHLEK